MTINEVLDELGILVEDDSEIKLEDGKYTLWLNGSDDYGDLYTNLTHLELKGDIETIPDSVVITEHNNVSKYTSDNYDLTITANYDSDVYKVEIEMESFEKEITADDLADEIED